MVRELCDIPHMNWRPPFYRAKKDGDLLLEKAHRRRHAGRELPLGHFRADVPDLSGEEIWRRETGKGALRLLSGQPPPLETAVRPAATRQSHADQGNEDSPPLALGIEPESGRYAAVWVLPRVNLSRS